MKQTIVRKDGITYERKLRNPTKLNKTLCLRISEDTFHKLKERGNVCTIIRNLIDIFLETNADIKNILEKGVK